MLSSLTWEQIRAESARRSLSDWCTYSDQTYVIAKHNAKFIAKLEQVERGQCRRLLVLMPPRCSKSETGSVKFPAWYMGRNPDKRVIQASHTASLADTFSRRSRNDLTEYGPDVFGVQVAQDSRAVDHWNLEGCRGGLIAAGVGGPLTGHGADLLIVDDPVKDAKAAESELQRKAVVDWYQQVARTRLHPGGAIVVIMTRWHEADLAGFLLAEATAGGEQWDVLSFPMIDEAGNVLWPERYSPEDVEGLRRAVGSRAWASLYQQQPAPAEGALLKRDWWKFYRAHEKPKNFETVVLSFDCAFKGDATSDYVVGQAWGKFGANCYLLEQVRGRWDFPRTCTEVAAMAARYPGAAVLIEDKANGPAVIATLRNRVQGLIAVEPDGGKMSRCSAVSPLIEAGNVHLPDRQDAPWADAFLHEASSFPYGANDDQVDAMTQALNRLKAGVTHIPKIRPRPELPRRVEH